MTALPSYHRRNPVIDADPKLRIYLPRNRQSADTVFQRIVFTNSIGNGTFICNMDALETIWDQVKSRIQDRIPAHCYRMWIEPVVQKPETGPQIVLQSPNAFSMKRMMTHYGDLITSEIREVLGFENQVVFEISESNGHKKGQKDPLEDNQIPLPNIHPMPHNGKTLRSDFTFDQFVVGTGNDFAYSAALSLACSKKSQQSALLLMAKPGLGKSHLSQAVGHHVLSNFPNERVYYVTAEDFALEMIHAFKSGTIDAFKEKYRSRCDVLLLEDIHLLSGKNRTQIELNFILEDLLGVDKKIIFTSCHLPSDIPKINDKLKSRLCSSLISNIEAPDYATRIKILKQKVRFNGYQICDDIIQYLASELTDDVRQLESGLSGVMAKASLLCAPLDLNLAGSVVKNMVQHRRNITVDAIKRLICKQYRISPDELTSRSRKQIVVRPRQIAMYLTRKYTDATL